MQIEIIPDSYSVSEYNILASHPLQSWQWGEARKKMGIKIVRFGIFYADKLTHVFQMSIHPIPGSPFSIGYIPRSSFPRTEFLMYIKEFAQKNKLVFVKFEPNTTKEEYEKIAPDTTQVPFVPSKHPLFPEWTMVMDISKPEEVLLSEMKSKTRYNIRLAQKKGVVVTEESTKQGFEDFKNLYFETTKRQKYFGHTPHYHEIIWDTLSPEIAHILVARFEGIPLAGYELFSFNNVFYYPYGGTSDQHRNVMAANLIMWEAILLGKKLGATSFDMWGAIQPGYDINHPWAGFTRFKEGYGASYVQMCGSFDVIANLPLYHLYTYAHHARTFYLNLQKRIRP